MKKLKLLFAVTVILAAVFSCKKETTLRPETEVTFNISNDIDNYEDVKFSKLTLVSENLTTFVKDTKTIEVTDNKADITLKLPEGSYNFSFEIDGTYTDNTLPEDDKIISSLFRAYLKSSQITGNVKSISVTPFLSIEQKADFVIEEIFYVGTIYPNTTKPYSGDQFIRITNNSDITLYADGLVISESAFATNIKNDYTPDIMEEAVAVQAIYKIPGNGKDYPVEAGKSIIVCDKAMNHITNGKPIEENLPNGNANSFNFDKADFEWYDISESSNITDTDNPEVPNLDKLYCYSPTVWMLNKQGTRTYTLSRFEDNVYGDEYEEKYKYDYSYIAVNGREMKFSRYKIPNSWVIDAVTIANRDKWKWNTVSSMLDAGYTSCGINSTDINRYGKSVRRKKLTTENGRVILKDTNNSSLDFEISTPKF